MSIEQRKDNPAKDSGLRPPGLLEAIPLKVALWFEGQLNQWERPIPKNYHPRRVPYTVAALVTGVGLVGLGSVAIYESVAKQQPIAVPSPVPFRPPEVGVGQPEMLLANRDYIATFRGGLVVNYDDRLKAVVLPSVLELLSRHPQAGINLPVDRQGFIFILPVTEQEWEKAQAFMEKEDEARILILEYDRQQNLRSQGLTSGKIFREAIPLYEIIQRVYQNSPNPPYEQRYHSVELELTLEWAKSMAAGDGQALSRGVSSERLTPEVINFVGNSRPLPFRVISLDPSLVGEVLKAN